MNIEQAVRDMAAALAAGEGARGRDAGLRAARQVVVDCCFAALGTEPRGAASLGEVVRLIEAAPDRARRRDCAVLLLHALAVHGLVPRALGAAVCTLIEGALRDALLRCGHPFGGLVDERIRVLRGLHRNISELMQPYEPTFPNWQGLYAG